MGVQLPLLSLRARLSPNNNTVDEAEEQLGHLTLEPTEERPERRDTRKRSLKGIMRLKRHK